MQENKEDNPYTGIEPATLFSKLPVTNWVCQKYGLKVQRRFPEEDQQLAAEKKIPGNHIYRGVD